MPAPSRAFFFDRSAVLKAVDKQTRAVLSKFGSFVRRTAKGLIRDGKRPAKPGNPPHNHKGTLKRFIFFAYEPTKHSVIIGPARLSGMVGDAPHALEHGGSSKIVTRRDGRRLQKSVHVAARPVMGPAAAKELPALHSLWPKAKGST